MSWEGSPAHFKFVNSLNLTLSLQLKSVELFLPPSPISQQNFFLNTISRLLDVSRLFFFKEVAKHSDANQSEREKKKEGGVNRHVIHFSHSGWLFL